MEKTHQLIKKLSKELDKDWRCLCEEFNENCEGCQVKKALNVIKSITNYEETKGE